jgi:hypothetical protein
MPVISFWCVVWYVYRYKSGHHFSHFAHIPYMNFKCIEIYVNAYIRDLTYFILTVEVQIENKLKDLYCISYYFNVTTLLIMIYFEGDNWHWWVDKCQEMLIWNICVLAYVRVYLHMHILEHPVILHSSLLRTPEQKPADSWDRLYDLYTVCVYMYMRDLLRAAV